MRSGEREGWAGLCACFSGWLPAKCLCLAIPPSDKELLVAEVPPSPARGSVCISCVPPEGYRATFSDGSLLKTGWGCKSCSAASKATGYVLGYLEMAEIEFLAQCSAVGQRDGLFFFPRFFATPFFSPPCSLKAMDSMALFWIFGVSEKVIHSLPNVWVSCSYIWSICHWSIILTQAKNLE